VFKEPESSPQIPVADWRGAWRELYGYVKEAVDDGGTITPAHMLSYMEELARDVQAPGRAWLKQMTSEN
jgi:hypothetical protein